MIMKRVWKNMHAKMSGLSLGRKERKRLIQFFICKISTHFFKLEENSSGEDGVKYSQI